MKKILLFLLVGIMSLGMNAQTLYGDVNGDNAVTISDVNCIISDILDGGFSANSDVNDDGQVNISDLNAIINAILGGGVVENRNNIVVSLPDGAPISLDDIIVMGSGERLNPVSSGLSLKGNNSSSYVTGANAISVMNKDSLLLYECYVSLDDNNDIRNVEVDATETAFTFLIPIFPHVFDGTPDDIYGVVKSLLLELDETHALAAAIDRSIVKNGYLDIQDIDTEYQIAVDKIIEKLGLRDNYLSGNAPRDNRFTQHTPSVVNGYGVWGYELVMNSSLWMTDGGLNRWLCELTAYNSNRFAYSAWVSGFRDSDGIAHAYDVSPITFLSNILKPQRVSTFVKKFTTWDGLKGLISDSWNLFFGDDFDMNDMTWDKTKLDLKMCFISDHDVVIAFAPADNETMQVYNWVKLVLDPVLKKIGKKFSEDTESLIFVPFVAELVQDPVYILKFKQICKTNYAREYEKIIDILEITWPEFKKFILKLFEPGAIFEDVVNIISVEETNWNVFLKWVERIGDVSLALVGLQDYSVYYNLNLDFNENAVFHLSPGELTIHVNETATVNIMNGNGRYDFSIEGSSGVVSTSFGSDKLSVKGNVPGTVTVKVKDLSSNEEAALKIKVLGPDEKILYVLEDEVEFGEVPLGETETNILNVVNNSLSSQTVAIEVGPPFSIAYDESSMSSLTIEVPGNACTPVTVMFTATTAGDFSGNITVQNSDLDGGQCIVPVHARAVDDVEPQAETFTVNGVSFKMVRVEGGTFTMGDTDGDGNDDEKPAHEVTLSSYNIGQTEVTQELWQAVMGSNPSYFKSDLNRPVEYVSWNDCQEFIAKLNQMTGKTFRLPTEAEWEFAARGGNHCHGYKYAGSDNIDEVAWYWKNIPSQSSGTSGYGTQSVATKAPNELGIYDMSGNVEEWCQDWYNSSCYSSSLTYNPTGPVRGYHRVCRGGNWNDYNARCCRVSSRNNDAPRDSYITTGLRLAMGSESGQDTEHEWVDLGLPSGTLWATCNVGANRPEEYGDYFAWGETEPKDVYTWENYKWCKGSEDTMTKYCVSSFFGFGYNGFTDGKSELDIEDDAAYVNWGPSWRMPTREQQQELADNCTWTTTRRNGESGFLVMGPNGNTLFLPEAYGSGTYSGSQGKYWSRTLHTGIYAECEAHALEIVRHGDDVEVQEGFGCERSWGLAVRAVRVP